MHSVIRVLMGSDLLPTLWSAGEHLYVIVLSG